MAAERKTLLGALEEFEKSLAGGTGGQPEDLARALATLEGALRREGDMLKEADGRIVDVDRPRIPSPTVERRTERLREELERFAAETAALRAKLPGASPPGVNADPATLGGALSVAPEAGALPDWGVLLQRARRLAHALEHFEDEEADLIFDSVNTDIGAGD